MITLDMTALIALLTGFLGLIMGSFAGAQVWRLRANQLAEDKEVKEPYDKAEYARLKPLMGRKTKDDRSQCLTCGHALSWYDLIPLGSWLSTGGKCRYCKKPIGKFEPLIEIGTAVLFAVFTYMWVAGVGISLVSLAILALWLAALTMLVILFVYDLKWFLLPDKIVFPLVIVAIVIDIALLNVVGTIDLTPALISLAASVSILSGLYLVLWLVSKGQWVGFGDVKLGVALGLLIADWRLALLTLFLANLIGTLVVLPGLLTKKLSRKTQVPFGPFLIVGFLISLLFGTQILSGYDQFSVWLTSVLLML